MKSLDLGKNISWIGSIDHDLKVFDIIMETEFGTSYNSYVIKGSEKIAVVETVKVKFFDEYLEKLNEQINPSDIDYIIVNHTEPDHAGSVAKLLEHAPKAVVVGSKIAIMYLKEIINQDFESIIMDVNTPLSLGDKTLEFVKAPFLHWPDSMYTYIREDKVLLTCDSFGSHYATDKVLFSKLDAAEIKDYEKALKYYYDAIFGPFKKYVLKAIEAITPLEIDLLLTGHGPVLDTGINEIIETYRNWSTDNINNDKKVVIMPYVSAYGYTTEVGMKIKEVIESNGDIVVKPYEIHIANFGELKADILNDFYKADGILFGTSTINGDALPLIWDLAINLNPIIHGGKIASAFGSYGWSGEGVPNIVARLRQLKLKVLNGYRFKFKASDQELSYAAEFAKRFAESVRTGKVPQ